MRIRVWLKGTNSELAREVDLKDEITPPVYPMNVRDYLCRKGYFSWSDYNRIRYERVKNGKTEED